MPETSEVVRDGRAGGVGFDSLDVKQFRPVQTDDNSNVTFECQRRL